MLQVWTDVRAIAAGFHHSMVLGRDGSVWATGRNDYGQLGSGSQITTKNFIEVIDNGAQAVAAGGWHSMVLNSDGSILATGEGTDGQLGDGEATDRSKFVMVLAPDDSGMGFTASKVSRISSIKRIIFVSIFIRMLLQYPKRLISVPSVLAGVYTCSEYNAHTR